MFGRLETVGTFDGHTQVNRYDAEGLRHEMEEDGELVKFIYRGGEVIAEEGTEGMTRHIRGYGLVASECESARTYYHYASDSLGSITHVVEGSEVLGRYGYDAWGNLTECEEKVKNRFRFCGEMQDPVSQQYYLRARYYNPVIGRFIQEDTYRGDGLNLYAYCANSPVNYVDPSGHWCETKQDVYNKLEAEARSRGEVIDGARKLELMAEAANAAKGKNAGADPARCLEGGGGNQEGGIPSGYYQDAIGKWHRPNGQFASNAEVGLPSNSDHYLNRPYIRQETIDVVNAKTKVNYETGQIYDSISKKWVDPSHVELGHTTGNEFAYYRNWAESQGMAQQQFNDFMNNPNFYAWQEIYSNRSHKFEDKH